MSTLLTTLFASIVGESEENSDALSIYAHDMKQYLLLNQELIARAEALSTSEEVLEVFKHMKSSLLHSLRQTNSLLLAERENRGKLEIHPVTLEVNELIKELVAEYSPLFESAGVSLGINLDPNAPQAKIDPAIFPSAIINLLDNALKYSRPRGKVLVSTKSISNRLIIEVSDNGVGIPNEDRDVIFSKHSRGKNAQKLSGSGLGLYIANKIINAHGGTLGLIKIPKFVTTFQIDLPLFL